MPSEEEVVLVLRGDRHERRLSRSTRKGDSMSTREKLAEYAHAAWAGWMKYLFEKSSCHEDGSVTIPPDLVERWQRQASTLYADLPANEQASDLEEADKMLTIMGESDAVRELNDRAQYEIYLLKCVGGKEAVSFKQFCDERLTEGGGS